MKGRTEPSLADRIARLVLSALENERALDLRYRAANPASFSDLRRIPNYKPMAQVALVRRLGVLYAPFIALAVFGVAASHFAHVGLALVRWARAPRLGPGGCFFFATVSTNTALILEAMSQEPASADGRSCAAAARSLDAATLSGGLGPRKILICALAVLLLYGRMLRCRGRRLDLALHARDAVFLAMLVAFSLTDARRAFWTDDHYQRWAFLLSSTSPGLAIVQHGFVDPDISFPFPFGRVRCLAVRHERFVEQFARYYAIDSWFVFGAPVSFDIVDERPLLLLASSAPHIDEEIAFLRAIKGASSVPIVVKLHPAHEYDDRKNALLALADFVSRPDQRPAARYFASHSSFMEYEYEAAGAITCSIARCGGASGAAQWLLDRLPGGSARDRK